MQNPTVPAPQKRKGGHSGRPFVRTHPRSSVQRGGVPVSGGPVSPGPAVRR